MLPRHLAVAIAITALVGCATPNNYDPSSNPFDEPVKGSQPENNAERPLTRVTTGSPLPSQKLESALSDEAVAIPFPAAPDRSLVLPPLEFENPLIQELVDEAARLGAAGDVHGKASILEQAGYTGSSKAFYDLARMYLDGSLPNDMPQALRFINLSHQAGYVEATRVLGMLYLRGQGVPADERYGRLLLEQASKTSARAAREYGQLLTNQNIPHLNDGVLGVQYLRDAAARGDRDAALSLAKVLGESGDDSGASYYAQAATALAPAMASPTLSVKDRALRGDIKSIFDYAQKVLLRRISTSEPEFTAYCWFAVAERMGSKQAATELGFIRGVKAVSDKENPGRLDQCISDLHYQISGRI